MRLTMTHLFAALLIGCLGCADLQAATPDNFDLLGLTGNAVSLPLGHSNLRQTVVRTSIAPGVTHYRIERGTPNSIVTWTLSSELAESEAAVSALKSCFLQAGIAGGVREFHLSAADRKPTWIVSGGEFSAHDAALRKSTAIADCRLYPQRNAESDMNGDGPWVLDIVAIDPTASSGQLTAVMASSGQRTSTSELSRAADSLIGINGGFFVERAADGFPGAPTGISILAGRVHSAPLNRRPAVVLTGQALKRIAIVRRSDWHAALLWSDGLKTPLDGLNRKLGVVRNCGRSPNEPTIHDRTCSYADDLVYLAPASPYAMEATAAIRFAIDRLGRARMLDAQEQPGRDDVLVAGSAGSPRIEEIRRQILRDQTVALSVNSGMIDEFGETISVVNAGPTLLMNGEFVREEAREGWAVDTVADAVGKLALHGWVHRRHPRTAIGIRDDGVTFLLTADGRRPERSVGLSIEELRQVFAALGARDAVNLDGGGSTTMVLRGRVVNTPSDAAGERKIGDAIVYNIDRS